MADQDPRDQIALLRSQFDQAREAYKELAHSVASYRSELVEAGVSETDALALTAGFQSMLLGFVFGAFGQVQPDPAEEGSDDD